MRPNFHRRSSALGSLLLGALTVVTAPSLAQPAEISEYITGSTPYVIHDIEARENAPNVLVWMIDDLGFGQLGAFGGIIDTPNLDKLAANGLVYTNYHTTPICSASRAALLTGRNSHTVHVGGHSAMSIGFPGYDARIPRSAGTIAANLKARGYLTYAIGKWDHLPPAHSSQSGPFTYWPSGQGFDKFYGFLTYDADNFSPVLWSDHSPVQLPENPEYHLTTDMADKAIDWISLRDSDPHRRPFFMYWATGAVHSPHHAPEADRIAYRGKFDGGWDEARAKILQRQKSLGVIPEDTELPPRPDGMKAWATLSDDEKKSYARAMEAFAAQLSHADREFGRILAALEDRGDLENTMIVVVADNGASAEGAPDGTFSEFMMANARYPDVEENLTHYDGWGGPDSYPHYPMGWAVAGNTPFQYYKQTAFEGAVRVPMIISWPNGIDASGEARNQYLHAIDIGPTIFESAGIETPESINGETQLAFDGTSAANTFDQDDAASPRSVQYYEMYGNRAIYADGWKAVVPHRLKTWDFQTPPSFETNEWQLFHVSNDINERENVADDYPDKLNELVELFRQQAIKYNVFPLTNTGDAQRIRAQVAAAEMAEREDTWTYEGDVARIPEALAPPIQTHAFKLTATVDMPEGVSGALMAIGGHNGGMALYFDDGRARFSFRNIDLVTTELVSDVNIPAGASTIELDFARRRNGADVTISANGKPVLSGTVPGPLPVFLFTSNETFDIGSDTGSNVSDYPGDFPFNGTINDVKVKVSVPEN